MSPNLIWKVNACRYMWESFKGSACQAGLVEGRWVKSVVVNGLDFFNIPARIILGLVMLAACLSLVLLLIWPSSPFKRPSA